MFTFSTSFPNSVPRWSCEEAKTEDMCQQWTIEIPETVTKHMQAPLHWMKELDGQRVACISWFCSRRLHSPTNSVRRYRCASHPPVWDLGVGMIITGAIKNSLEEGKEKQKASGLVHSSILSESGISGVGEMNV
ncbi:uncharacterized protein CIMG_01411 [Coccidioides immitis RS]|uniref:Uncharacterized protein n=1 Tax=Coccidioides immitis (strain RS) TaxID=246410 RepID=J3KJ55_COCIM|nr:uncharacterized protein CIMG_01411 [Coccidioides immitis RS]EAS36057.3 hypothetical protein CIMG_01411 [Coccidioides immitis RS]